MRGFYYLSGLAIAALAAAAATAQFVPASDSDPMPTTGPRVPENYWSAKPTQPTPYVAPNRVHWKLSDVMAMHRGKTDWVQPIVRNPEQEADYISLGVGKRTKAQAFADDRVVWIVQDGAMRVSIDGMEPFVATKGFMVNVPFRHFYTIETIGDRPSLRFEVRQAGSPPMFKESDTPDAYPGRTYVKVRGTPGPAKDRDSNPIWLDFNKQIASSDKPHNGKFVWDDHFTSNILRGKAQQVPPESNRGHFHGTWTEFWFIMEGKVDYKIEGFPLFTADQGDVVAAVKGRWHRPSNNPNVPMSTRIPFNPRPVILHNFDPQ